MGLKRRPPKGNVCLVAVHGKNGRGFTTNKAGETVQFESWNERLLLFRLRRDPAVRDFVSKPELFSYKDSRGRPQSFVPAFKIWLHTGAVEIHHIVYNDQPLGIDIRDRDAAMERICRARGWRYITHPVQSLPQGAERANLQALYLNRALIYDDQRVSIAARELLQDGQQLRLRAIANQIADAHSLTLSHVIDALCHLLWQGQLNTDWSKLIFIDGAIAPKALVWLEIKQVHS